MQNFGYAGAAASPALYGHQQYSEVIQVQPQYQEMMQTSPQYSAVTQPIGEWSLPVLQQDPHHNNQASVVFPQGPKSVLVPMEYSPQTSIMLPPVPVASTIPEDPPQKTYKREEQLDACCSTPVAASCFGAIGVSFFVFFVTITCAMVYGSNRQFCNDYWKTTKDPTKSYQLAGFSTVGVWALIMGSTIFILGLFWFLENRAAANQARGLRDQLRTILMLGCFFGWAWLACGNVWVIGSTTNTYMGITIMNGVVPDDCKKGSMGDNSFYYFCYVIIIILDILAPLAMFYAGLRTCMNKTFAG